MRVLVVEDSPANQLLARAQLSRLGYEPEIAESGERALEMLDQSSFDAVLMDWHMPGIDGLETTRRIRAAEKFAELPIIAMTANAVSGDRETCLAAGMDDYLSKPVSIGDLEVMLKRWLGDNIHPSSADDDGEDLAVNWSTLDTMAAEIGDPGLIETLLRTFLAELPKQVAQIAVLGGVDGQGSLAISDDALEVAMRAAHTLKSTAATMGAARLASVAAELETQLRAGCDDAGALSRDVVDAAEQTRAAFEGRLGELTADDTQMESTV